MPKAIWNNQVIAEAPASEIHRVEGNVYSLLSAVKQEFFMEKEIKKARQMGRLFFSEP